MPAETIEGDLVVNGSLSASSIASSSNISRSSLEEDALQSYTINFADIRVHDAVSTVLPSTGANDDFGLVGADYTSTPILNTKNHSTNNTNETVYGRFFFPLPAEYVTGGDIRVQITTAYNTTAPDTTGTIDVECKLWDTASTSLGSDLVTTSAQSMATTAFSTKTFVVNAANRSSGETLDFRVSMLTNDSTGSGSSTVVGEITKIVVLLDIRG